MGILLLTRLFFHSRNFFHETSGSLRQPERYLALLEKR